jgi:hypothetical protein
MNPLWEEVVVGKGGGSSSSETVTVTSTDTGTVDILGLDDVSVTLNVPDPITTNSTYTTSSTLLVPDTIKNDSTTRSDVGLKSDLTLDVKPLETTIDVKPLETTIDLKPVVVDLCYTVNVGRLPETRIRNPYRHHVGLTLFGADVLGMTFEGEQDTVVEDLHRQPMVVEGREYFEREREHGRFEHEHRGNWRRDDGDGLHIRVGP